MADKTEKLVRRSDKVAFLNVGSGEESDFQRMRKFTDLSTSKNPQEYGRQYVDEDGEETDVVGFSPEISYGFDQYTNNPVHEKIAKITDDELKGDDAIVELLVVDKTSKDEQSQYTARRRKYSVVPDSEGDSTDAYTYSGTLKSKGTFEEVKVTLDEAEQKATIATP